MVDALKAVAGEAEMQIFVATRNAQPLLSICCLMSNRIVAEGERILRVVTLIGSRGDVT